MEIVSPGSFPGLRAIAKGQLSSNARGAPKINPLLSIPRMVSIEILRKLFDSILIDSLKASISIKRVVISLNCIPVTGKSGIVLMAFRIFSLSISAPIK